MVRDHRFLRFLLGAALFSLLCSCSHPAERALEGRWNGQSVENFDKEAIAGATAWARGTSFEFRGERLKVTVPAQKARTGIYRLTAIEDRQVTISVLDSDGEEDQLDLIVDDAESLRWVLEEGRTLVMKRQNL